MRTIKLIAVFIFIFLITLFGVVGFDTKKITLIQLGYNFFQSLIFFAIVVCFGHFDRLLKVRKHSRSKSILFKLFFVLVICGVIAFLNHALKVWFDSEVVYWRYYILLIVPATYLIFSIFKAIDESMKAGMES